jgi:2-dehydro-3-deoxyphosphooctonate aldolase (KDO 8-P synthase)
MTATTPAPWRSPGLFVIAGPCVIESRAFALETAAALREVFARAGVPFVYKSSFDKANRTSVDAFRGVGLPAGLAILAEIRETLGVPVLTDVHERDQAAPAAEAVDVLQTPAFLCRQSDFLAAVAATGRPVNIKKGQFLAPWDMASVVEKAKVAAREAGHPDPEIFACERGTTFGYGDLVVDMRSLAILKETTGCPVVFDATHAVQRPGARGRSSGGERAHAPLLARAAVATGAVAGVFLETHPDPDRAPCDGPNMIPFGWLPELLDALKAIDAAVRGRCG